MGYGPPGIIIEKADPGMAQFDGIRCSFGQDGNIHIAEDHAEDFAVNDGRHRQNGRQFAGRFADDIFCRLFAPHGLLEVVAVFS